MGPVHSIVSCIRHSWPLVLLKEPLPYEYAPLEKTRQIRLLKLKPRKWGHLQCSVEIVDLDSAPPFTALSYTHGCPIATNEEDQRRIESLPLVPLFCEGKEFLIKINLATALRRLDQMCRYGYYWIDAVCINQGDVLERESQVKNSKVALRFLEEVLPKARDMIREDAGKPDDSAHPYRFLNSQTLDKLGMVNLDDDVYDVLEDLVNFFDRRWFCRAWTLQETLLPPKIDVLCGPTEISWKKLRRLLDFLDLTDWSTSLLRFEKSSWEQLGIIPGGLILSTMKLRNGFFHKDPYFEVYLSNLGGGGENMDMLLGYISLMMNQMRLRSATDPRDYFFGMYGVVSRLCDMANLPNPLIDPDYTKTIAEVFTANIRSMLAHSKSLVLLSHVEDESQRKRTDLPSWVPDMTSSGIETLIKEANAGIFNASRISLAQILPSPNTETLRLAGYWIDCITDVGDDDDSAGCTGRPYEKSAVMLLKMPRIYVNGQDLVEAFWRTCIADVGVGGVYPAPETLGRSFREHLITKSAEFLYQAQAKGDREYQAAMQQLEPLLALAKASPKGPALIPSLEETLRRKDIYDIIGKAREDPARSELHMLGDGAEDAELKRMWQDVILEGRKRHAFVGQLGRVHLARRLFRTSGGLMGLGPRSLRPGDHTFVLPGGQLPFVLRPVGKAGGTTATYKLVGEAYVHGIMQGEAIHREELKKMELDLV